MPTAEQPATLIAVKTYEQVRGYVYMLWETRVGILAVAYPTIEDNGASRALWVREFQPGIRCLVEVVWHGFRAPDGPDVLDQAIDSSDRRVMWRHYARAIGQPAPYWPQNLNYRHLIEQWCTGHTAVTTVPRQSPDMTPLVHLAALYEPGSPTHQVLMHYYTKSLRSAAGHSIGMLESLNDYEFFPNLADKLVPAAQAVDVPKPQDLDNLSEHGLRAVFAGLLERQDTLTVQAVHVLREWGATKYMPFARYDKYEVGRMSMLEEWRTQLDEVPAYLPVPRFAGLISDDDKVRGLFIDRATGAPVVAMNNFRGDLDHYATLQPRRLPATSPLAELIIDAGGHSNWIRTADGTLYPAPRGEYDVAWGYSGSGFAPLVERLLADITTPPLDGWITPSDNGLTTLSTKDVPNGTVFTRADLEIARQHPR